MTSQRVSHGNKTSSSVIRSGSSSQSAQIFIQSLTVSQAVISQPDGLEGDGCAEAQYAYYPASIADGSAGTMVTAVQAPDALLGQNTPTGEL